MFDIAVSLNFSKTNTITSLDIEKFPDQISPSKKHLHSDWYDIRAYYHENLYHQWFSPEKNFKLFSLGQILFRADSKYSNTNSQNVLHVVLDIWNSKEILTNHIKGNFILLIFDELNQELKVITSRSCHYELYFVKINSIYYLSTSLSSLLAVDKSLGEIDPIALIETGIFDYPLGRKTLYKKIKWLDQGCIYTISERKSEKKEYFSWTNHVKEYNPKLSWKQSYSEIPVVFNNVLSKQLEGKDKIISAITSGFDSRTVLSYLLKSGFKDCLYYSWGKKDQVDVLIPQELALEFGFNYILCDFDDDFQRDYLTSAENAIYFSNARATLRRANHFYYYKVLSQFSRYNFTGLYGSELLRPISTIGHMFNENFLKILLNPSDTNIHDIIENEKQKGYLNPIYVEQNADSVFDHVKQYISCIKQDLPDYLALYNFTLNSGLMKYFGHEIHGARAYLMTLSPYLDDEFIEFIFQTPVLGLDKIALDLGLKQSLSHTRRGQLLYLPIINSNCQKLMYSRTGRFYSPSQLVSPFYPLSILPALLAKRKYKNSLPMLGSEEWISRFINKNLKTLTLDKGMFEDIPTYTKDNFLEYAKNISLRWWMTNVTVTSHLQHCEE